MQNKVSNYTPWPYEPVIYFSKSIPSLRAKYLKKMSKWINDLFEIGY